MADPQAYNTPVELPARRASHWTLRNIYSAAVPVFYGQDVIDVSVSTEVPRDDEGPVQKHGNRYWPSYVDIGIRDEQVSMTPEEARAVAHALLRAAEVCEAEDVADVHPVCGHWAPCECKAEGR